VSGQFLRIGFSQFPDSLPQRQALSAGIDKLMLAPGYDQFKDQFKDQLKEFCRWMNAMLKFHLNPGQ